MKILPAIVTSHLDSDSKIGTAIGLIKRLKSQGRTVILVGNFPFTVEVQNLCDYCLYTNENPKSGMFYVYTPINKEFNINRKYTISMVQDYGAAHMILMQRGFEIARFLGFSNAIHLNYDVDPEAEILEKIDEMNGNIIFNATSDVNSMNSTLFKFDVNSIIGALDKTIDRYLKNTTKLEQKRVYCESIMKWMMDEYKLQYTLIPNYPINTTQGYMGGYLINGIECETFYDPIDKIGYVKANRNLELDSIQFNVNGMIVNADRTSTSSNFYRLENTIEDVPYYYNEVKSFIINNKLKANRYLANVN